MGAWEHLTCHVKDAQPTHSNTPSGVNPPKRVTVTPEVEVGAQGGEPCGSRMLGVLVVPPIGDGRQRGHVGIVEVGVRGLVAEAGIDIGIERAVILQQLCGICVGIAGERRHLQRSLGDVGLVGQIAVVPIHVIEVVAEQASIPLQCQRRF